MRTGQKRRGGGKMAAPEERDLTQEQTEKLLQFQVAASTRCSRCRCRLRSRPLEAPEPSSDWARESSQTSGGPLPADANCSAAPGPRASVGPRPSSQSCGQTHLPSAPFPFSPQRVNFLIFLRGSCPQPSFPTLLPIGSSLPDDSGSSEMPNSHC